MAKIKLGKKKRDWFVIGATAIVLVLLSAKLITLGWRIFKPAEQTVTIEEPENPAISLGSAANLFGLAPQSMLEPRATADIANIKVYGIFAGKKKTSGYALFLIDGEQREVFGVGQEVAPGLQLAEIGADYVMLKGARGDIKIPIIEEKTGTTSLGVMSANGFSGSSSSPVGIVGNSTRSSEKRPDIFAKGDASPAKPAAPTPRPPASSQSDSSTGTNTLDFDPQGETDWERAG